MTRGSKWHYLLVALFAVPMSIFLAWEEIRYMHGSATAEATIQNVTEKQGSGRRSSPQLIVEYSFTDAAGRTHHDSDKVPTSWNDRIASVTTIPVQYLTSTPDKSRLEGHNNNLAMVLFFGIAAFTVGGTVWKWRRPTT